MPKAPLSKAEFIALIGVMFAAVAFSVDAMLPAFPALAASLSPDAPNNVQLVITSFMLGLGAGTLLAGPLADAFGRRLVILAGFGIYILAAFFAWQAQTLEALLAARVVQGFGAAAPRVAALAIVRDLYKGREMAKIISIAFIIFTLFPAIAPAVGALIIDSYGWRAIFPTYVLFAVLTGGWLFFRQPETLPRADRRPFKLQALIDAIRELFGYRQFVYSILVQSLIYGVLFSMLSSVQPVFEVFFDRAESFPYWFGLAAVLSGTSGFVNAALVNRFGIRFLVTTMMAVQVPLGAVVTVAFWIGMGDATAFAVFFFWQVTVFFQIGMCIGNLNALGMEPAGHIAGTAASVLGALATVAGVGLAVPVGQAFNGTPVPLILGVVGFSAGGFWLMRRLDRRNAPAAPEIAP